MTPRKQINISLSDLHISRVNMRKERKKPVVIDILPSIQKLGLLCPLLVREEKNGWGVVAGRRRWHCLKLIEKEAGNPVTAPCIVLGADDDAAAIEASILENIARLPPTETQQFEAFGKLDNEGQSVEEIAQTFGVTELAVRRVLALANLNPAIRKLYANEEIDRETARALTLASAEQQAEWLRRFESEIERAPVRSECKRWVTGGAIIPAKNALFDLAEYPGTILDDLFGENAVFADPAEFWEAQNTAIAEKVQAIKVSGWQDVIIMERGETFYSYQHTERPKTKGGKVFVEVRHNGEVIFHEGYITDAEDRKERKQSQIDRATEPEVKPEMTGPMAQFIGEHRSRNVKADLLEKPGHALRLTVALMMQGSSNFGLREHQPKAMKDYAEQSLCLASSTLALTKEREAITELLKANGEVFGDRQETSQDYRLARTFAVLLKMSDEEVTRCLIFLVAMSLEPGTPIVEALSFVMSVDHAAYWEPEAAFYNLLRDKDCINAMLSEIGTPRLAQSMITDTAREQKNAIHNHFSGTATGKAAKDWRPRWMTTVPTRYIKKARNPIVEAWESVSSLFTNAEKKPAPVEAVPDIIAA